MSAPPPFVLSNLSVLAYCHHTNGHGFTFWHYRGTAKTLAEIRAPYFFVGAIDMLADGDMMAVSADDGGAVLFVVNRDGRPVLLPLAG